MAFCSNCGKPLTDGAKFCAECGTPVGAATSVATSTTVEILPISAENKVLIEGFLKQADEFDDRIAEEEEAYLNENPLNSTLSSVKNIWKAAMKGEDVDASLISASAKAKSEFIRNFEVPSDVSILIEFMSAILPKYKAEYKHKEGDGYTNESYINEAWISKIRETYTKLELILPATSAELQRFSKLIETMGIPIFEKKETEPERKSGFFSKFGEKDIDKALNSGGSINIVKKESAFGKLLMENSAFGMNKKIEDVANLQFETSAEAIQQQLNNLFTQISGVSRFAMKSLYNAIKEKIEFGIMKLNSMGANAEADFFQKKFDKLK